jgi:hypothetical protein
MIRDQLGEGGWLPARSAPTPERHALDERCDRVTKGLEFVGRFDHGGSSLAVAQEGVKSLRQEKKACRIFDLPGDRAVRACMTC